MDFPYSPVRLATLMMSEGASRGQVALVRTAAGMAYLISLISLAVFVIAAAAARLAIAPQRLQRLGQPAHLRPDGRAAMWSTGWTAMRALTLR